MTDGPPLRILHCFRSPVGGIFRHVRDLAIEQLRAAGVIEYVPLPAGLKGRYQSYTEADVTALARAGCQWRFADVGEGVARYVDWLAGDHGGAGHG